MARLGIVTGLASEAGCLASLAAGGDAMVLCAGADGGRAGLAARQLIERGCGGLLSFGMAGGLDPDLAPGAVTLPRRVLDAAGHAVTVDEPWRDRLAALLSGMAIGAGDIAGSTELVASVAAKQRLRQMTGAAAVDMESLALGKEARRAGIPFLVVRVIADPADRAPPPWAADTIDAAGRVRTLAALWALLRHPADLPTAMSLAGDSRAALAALRRVAAGAGPLFGL